MRKRDRQQLVETLVRQGRLSGQGELVAALLQMGITVTQATISRDLREMGVQKGTDRQGRVRYVLPAPSARRDPEAVLARVLRESGAICQAAQNLVVVRMEPGTASGAGRAIDELDHEDIVGTVAGDDTVLMVLGDASRARRMAKYLIDLMQG